MLAAVLSGGGNHGALQAGALEVLLKAGVEPDLWVGTSAGGLNSIVMASDPTVHGAIQLQDIWRYARPIPQAAAGMITAARRLATGKDSFFPNEAIVDYFHRHMPAGLETFGQLYEKTGLRALTVAVEFPGGAVRIFGDRREDRLLDGAIATSAFPPYLPPWVAGGKRYVDGGLCANVPVRIAAEHGATEILALDIHGAIIMAPGSGLLEIAGFALSTMIERQTEDQFDWARREGIRLHYLRLDAGPVPPWDFTQADTLIARGKKAAEEFLSTGVKIPQGATWRYRGRSLLGRNPRPRPW